MKKSKIPSSPKKAEEITRADILKIEDPSPLKCSAPGPWTKSNDAQKAVFLMGLGAIRRFETISQAAKLAASHGRRIKVTSY